MIDNVAAMYRVLLTLFAVIAAVAVDGKPLATEVAADAALLMNGGSGRILYEKSGYDRYYPASITKIATALVALEECHDDTTALDNLVTIDHDTVAWVDVAAKRRARYSLPPYRLEPGGTHIGLKVGEELTIRDLLYGMLVASGNDAANAIAKHTGGEIPAFMDKVNLRLQELGCRGTQFVNPSGLYHPDHYTTAYDMALITREALRHPLFRTIVSTRRYPRPKTTLQDGTTLVQSNKLLFPGPYYYPYAIGVKTGRTHASQYTLVAAAEKEGRQLIAVLLKDKEYGATFRDAVRLFDAAFSENLVEKVLIAAGPQPFTLTLPGAASPVTTYTDRDVVVKYFPAEEPRLSCKLEWQVSAPPVTAGQTVALLTISSDDGNTIDEIPLKAASTIGEALWHTLHKLLPTSWSPMQLLAALVLALFLTAGLVARSRR